MARKLLKDAVIRICNQTLGITQGEQNKRLKEKADCTLSRRKHKTGFLQVIHLRVSVFLSPRTHGAGRADARSWATASSLRDQDFSSSTKDASRQRHNPEADDADGHLRVKDMASFDGGTGVALMFATVPPVS